MPSGDMLKVGTSGLQVFQRSLNTIGHNISNVNTEGYSRQRVNLETRYPSPSGNGFIGNGVKAITTERLFSEYSTEQVRQRTATANYFDVYSEFSSQVDNLVADPDAGLSPAINDFFDSLQEVADDPASIPARNVMLTNAEGLVDRFATMDSWFTNLQKAANSKIVSEVSAINEIATSIANLNKDIIVARGIGNGQDPNDLLDKRDQLIDKLAEHISLKTVKSDDGSINVFVGNGQSLVLATKTMKLSALNNLDDPQNKDVGYIDPVTGASGSVTNLLTGGELGGILKFREEVLQPSINSLGRLALGISTTFNAQHIQGQDLNSNLGTNFFDGIPLIASLIPGDPDVPQLYATEATSNAAPNPITVRLNDINNLSTDEYQLTYDGANYNLTNLNTRQVEILVVSVAGPPIQFSPVTASGANIGMDIELTNVPAVTDRFFIRPTRNPSGEISLAISDPNLIAAAYPLRTEEAFATNLGSASISEVTITDITDPDVFQAATITFTNSGGGISPPIADEYTITYTDSFGVPQSIGPLPYPPIPGDPLLDTVNLNGWTVELSGEAFVNDVFTVGPNTSGVSDNRNALLLGDLQTAGTMIGGNASYYDAYSELVVLVGNETSKAEVSYEAQNALLTQAKSLKDSLSGVNLDEEAANMLKFQQAYAAAAQVISVADQIFQTLINAVRR